MCRELRIRQAYVQHFENLTMKDDEKEVLQKKMMQQMTGVYKQAEDKAISRLAENTSKLQVNCVRVNMLSVCWTQSTWPHVPGVRPAKKPKTLTVLSALTSNGSGTTNLIPYAYLTSTSPPCRPRRCGIPQERRPARPRRRQYLTAARAILIIRLHAGIW